MTGEALFEALSFVDEQYIQEAETADLGRSTSRTRWISLVACLCIFAMGVLSYGTFFDGRAKDTAAEEPAVAAPAVTEMGEAAGAPLIDGAPKEESQRAEDSLANVEEGNTAPAKADETVREPEAYAFTATYLSVLAEEITDREPQVTVLSGSEELKAYLSGIPSVSLEEKPEELYGVPVEAFAQQSLIAIQIPLTEYQVKDVRKGRQEDWLVTLTPVKGKEYLDAPYLHYVFVQIEMEVLGPEDTIRLVLEETEGAQ